jgi:hypothetical protein
MALALSAQRLIDGVVIYWTADGNWADEIDAAQLVESKADGAALEAKAVPFVKAQQIVNPNLIEVARDGARIIGKSARELIRAKGPTVRLDLGKQAREAGA